MRVRLSGQRKMNKSPNKLIRIDRMAGIRTRSVIIVFALFISACCCHHVIKNVEANQRQQQQHQHQTTALKQHQQTVQAKNDYDQRNIQIPIAQKEATSTETVAVVGKNASSIEKNDDLLVAASSTTASAPISSAAQVQMRKLASSGTENGSSKISTGPTTAATTAPTTITTTSAGSPFAVSAVSSAEGGKRRLGATGSNKATHLAAFNQQVAHKGKQQQHANELHSQSLRPSAEVGSDNHQTSSSEQIERMSTSQSVSFAEPSSSNINRQAPQSQARYPSESAPIAVAATTVSSRWTHFGARLKPLATSSSVQHQNNDHYEGSSNSPAYSKVSSAGSHIAARQPSGAALATAAAKSNELASDDERDDVDDDQDNEALLYKMMQQQSFLMSPNWQQLDSTAAIGGNRPDTQQRQQQTGQNRQQQAAVAAETNGQVMGEKDSKRVIKLLKSYSHIHQVDDSGDQIRGTYTRFASRRQPATAEVRNRNHWETAQSGRGNGLQSNQHSRVRSQQGMRTPINQQHQRPRVDVGDQEDEGDDDGNQLASNGRGNENQEASTGREVGSNATPGAAAAPEEEEFECPNNGIFADEASGCQSYHVCQAGAQVQEKFQCPMGTLFNNIILTCDFAHNVQCHGAAAKKAAAAAAAGSQEPASSQQPTWRPTASAAPSPRRMQGASQGPRRLQIGQSQHSQLSSLNPPPAEEPQENNEGDNDNDSGSDDAPPEPLKPAQLPPSRRFRPNLPYNQPPQPEMMGEHHHQIGTEATPAFSDAPAQTTQVSSTASNTGTNRFSPATSNLVGGQHQLDHQSDDQSQSYNLVINHVSPTRTLPPKLQFKPNERDSSNNNNNIINNYLVASSQPEGKRQQHQANQISIKPAQPSQQLQQIYQKSRKAASLPATSQYQQERQHPGPSRQTSSSPLVSGSGIGGAKPTAPASQRGASYGSQRQPQQAQSISTSKQRASQVGASAQTQTNYLSAAHHQRQQQQQLPQVNGARPVLVDLTSDRGQQSVSSEAMNDGLLLLVRHEPGFQPSSAPHSQYISQTNRQQHQGADKQASRQQQYVAAASGHRPTVFAGSSGKAVAVAPSLVRSDSPVDAQLFPNVQQALAETRGQVSQQQQSYHVQVQHGNGQAPGSAAAASVNVIKTVTPPAASSTTASTATGPQNGQASRVLGPLPPMEPPKPSAMIEQSAEQQVGKSSSSQSSSHGQNKKVSHQQHHHHQKPSQKPTTKKNTKHLKASQLPQTSARPHSQTSSTPITTGDGSTQSQSLTAQTEVHLASSSDKQSTRVSAGTKPQVALSTNPTTSATVTSTSGRRTQQQQQV